MKIIHQVNNLLILIKENKNYLIAICVFIFLNAWTVTATIHNVHKAVFMILLTSVIWVVIIWIYVLEKFVQEKIFDPLKNSIDRFPYKNFTNYFIMLTIFVGLFAYSGDSKPFPWKYETLLRHSVILIFASILLSSNPARINWRPVIFGIILQVIVALLVLKWHTGRTSINWFTTQVVTFLSYTQNGTNFVFGFIPNPPPICGMDGPFAFTSLPVIIFFGAICSVLYYYGVIQWVLVKTATLLQYTMGTTSGESLNAVASVFLGPTEASILSRTALPTMTDSEIFATLTAGFCMISGSLFAIYIGFGACPVYLIASNVMSAPALLTVTKLMAPEVQRSKQKYMKSFKFPKCEDSSFLESISNGAIGTIRVLFAIIANLIVYVAAVTLVDTCINWLGTAVGHPEITFNKLMSWMFYPVAYVLGVTDPDQIMKLAELIGYKTVLNEFIAYQNMQTMLENGELKERTQMIAIFACCGYSNFSQIGTQIGIFCGLCPKRKKTFVKVVARTLVAGAITCFMTACIAGAIVSDPTGCMPNSEAENCLNV